MTRGNICISSEAELLKLLMDQRNQYHGKDVQGIDELIANINSIIYNHIQNLIEIDKIRTEEEFAGIINKLSDKSIDD